jgi:Sigma-70 region 2
MSGKPRLGATKRTPVRISNIGGEKQSESPNNLSAYRWTHPLPSPEEDAELVRRAKGGCRKAATQLVKNYHRLIVGRAGKHKINHEYRKGRRQYGNGVFDDFIGRGFEALWRAVLNYDETRGEPFSAYAKRCISGQISEEAKAFVKRGSVGETRLERWLFSHPHATPKELVAAFKKKGADISLYEARDAVGDFRARCDWRRYDEADAAKREFTDTYGAWRRFKAKDDPSD